MRSKNAILRSQTQLLYTLLFLLFFVAGTMASYGALKNGKTVLFIRSSDGTTFGTHRELDFTSADNLRGWSWDGTTASYLAVKNGKTVLFIRSFDGTTFGTHRELAFTSADNIRGWSWNGTTASYLAVKNGKTVLIIRSFDGANFGTHRELAFTSADNIRGWSWNGTTASYLAVKNGKTVLFIRSFDGTTFGTHRELAFTSADNLRGWSWGGTTASYLAVKNGKTVFSQETINYGDFIQLESQKGLLGVYDKGSNYLVVGNDRSGSHPKVGKNTKWRITRNTTSTGSGPVKYGDRFYLLNAELQQWLSDDKRSDCFDGADGYFGLAPKSTCANTYKFTGGSGNILVGASGLTLKCATKKWDCLGKVLTIYPFNEAFYIVWDSPSYDEPSFKISKIDRVIPSNLKQISETLPLKIKHQGLVEGTEDLYRITYDDIIKDIIMPEIQRQKPQIRFRMTANLNAYDHGRKKYLVVSLANTKVKATDDQLLFNASDQRGYYLEKIKVLMSVHHPQFELQIDSPPTSEGSASFSSTSGFNVETGVTIKEDPEASLGFGLNIGSTSTVNLTSFRVENNTTTTDQNIDKAIHTYFLSGVGLNQENPHPYNEASDLVDMTTAGAFSGTPLRELPPTARNANIEIASQGIWQAPDNFSQRVPLQMTIELTLRYVEKTNQFFYVDIKEKVELRRYTVILYVDFSAIDRFTRK